MGDLINAFLRILQMEVEEFVEASRAVGESVSNVASMVREAFQQELQFIELGIKRLQPDDLTLRLMVEPLVSVLRQIQEFKERNRHDDKFFNHIATIAESIEALIWFTAPLSTPAQFIRDMKEAGDYFGNRVLSSNKGNKIHQNWIQKWRAVLSALEGYVKEYHRTGFVWNVSNVASGSRGRLTLPHPPPPPPMPEGVPGDCGGFINARDPAASAEREALLRDLNQGVGIIQRLRPTDRGAISRSRPAQLPRGANTLAQAPQRVYEPVFRLEGKKWKIEHCKDDPAMELHSNDMSESLSMYKCQNIRLNVVNKMNSITIDSCKRGVIYLHDVIASVDLIRCTSIELRCLGNVPLINLDNCDCGQIFLTEQALNAEIVHSKCASMNVCLLKEDGDYIELPVPEQIKSLVVDRRLLSTPIEKM